MKRVDFVDYMNKENIWALRLLGYQSFARKRDILHVEKEYNIEKYGALLHYDFKTIEEYKRKEWELSGLKENDLVHISFKDEIFQTTLSIARNLRDRILKVEVENYLTGAICELGCGYGYNLSLFEGREKYGGEYSRNAVSLAQKLGLDVCQFNYYRMEDYEIIRDNTTVLTVHSLEQLPDASAFIDGLSRHKDKINFVIHFEPTYIEQRSNLIGLFRNKYIEVNDYNRNLLSLLQNRVDIEIIRFEQDLFGLNPLNSTNFIVWRFKY